MDFTLNFDDDFPLFSDSYDFSLDLEPKISKDIKYHLLSDTLESQKSSPINPRKDLFITKKIPEMIYYILKIQKKLKRLL